MGTLFFLRWYAFFTQNVDLLSQLQMASCHIDNRPQTREQTTDHRQRNPYHYYRPYRYYHYCHSHYHDHLVPKVARCSKQTTARRSKELLVVAIASATIVRRPRDERFFATTMSSLLRRAVVCSIPRTIKTPDENDSDNGNNGNNDKEDENETWSVVYGRWSVICFLWSGSFLTMFHPSSL